MKKISKILCVLLAVCSIPLFFVSCKDTRYGNYDSTGEKYDYYLPDYIKVCNYSGLEVPNISTEPTEEDVDNQMMYQISLYAPRNQDPDRGVIKGDVVEISTSCIFTDTGEEYSLLTMKKGNKEAGQAFCVGMNYFFTKGIDDAVIGMKAGETKKVKFTLPDPYYKDLVNSGREVEMEIYLVYIDEVDYSAAESGAATVTENNFYTEHFGYTEEQYREMMRNQYQKKLVSLTENYKQILTWDYICDNSKVKKLPEKEYDEYYNGKLDSDRSSAQNDSKTLAEYVKDQYGYENMDDYYANIKEYAEGRCKEEMILYYIIRCEKIELPDDYYEAQLQEMGKEYQLENIEDIEDFFSYYYGGLEKLKESITFQYTQQWIADHAKVRDDVTTMYGLKK